MRAGSLFAGRFRVIREVGAGGMGVVYEAWDDLLHRRVALKCANAGHRGMLPPEVRAARDVSHFHVCKVHDIHIVPGPEGNLEFLSMEFVEGETLARRIRREGPLATAEAKVIALQICAGLAQAHKQGVIHGDLKCENVILGKSGANTVRAVITDFGLAKFADPDGSHIVSGRGGTVDYMAPELLMGERATVASDLYALGVLFHVMLTGHSPERIGDWKACLPAKPKPGNDSADTVTMLEPHIAEANWRRRTEETPKPWKQVIGRCLEASPQRRFATAGQLIEALEPRRTFLKWAAAAVAVATLSVAYWQSLEPPLLPPVRLAVLPFRVDGGPISGALGVASDVANRLSGARRNFSIISPLDARQNQVDTPEKARTILGATHVLETRLNRAGGHVAATASLIDAASGQSLAGLKGDYPEEDQATLAKALIGTVTGALRLRASAPTETVSDAAYPHYIRGMNLLEGDLLAAADALPHLEKAVALDPRSALPHALLARAQLQRFLNKDGNEWLDRAEATVSKARSINPDSVRVLLVAGEVDQYHGRYEQAVRAFTRATELDPDETQAWIRLANTYEQSNQDSEAAATYQKAIAAQPNGYRAYLNFGNFYLSRAQYSQAEDLYRKVTATAPAFSGGYINLGLALQQQGRFRDAEQAMLKALSLRESPQLHMNIGALYYEEERFQEALTHFQKSAQARAGSAAVHRNLGDAYRHLGRPKEAADAYRSARSRSEEEVARNPRAAASRVRIAFLSALLGEPRRAEYEVSQALSQEPGNAAVMREAVKTYEILRQRDRAIAVLERAPKYLLHQLNRQPDVKRLRRDPRFQQLLQK